jgi:alpha-D-ribose 1-methylphosphonate 5-triphosphate synthase subunit PhnL
MSKPILSLDKVGKEFTIYRRSNQPIQVLKNVSFDVFPGECLSLDGDSGTGKSSILKIIVGNYKTTSGHIWCQYDGDIKLDFAAMSLREQLLIRRKNINYVSQFLRAIPRLSALELVIQSGMDSLQDGKQSLASLTDQAKNLLVRLQIPEHLWGLPPAIFSGGQQQRINLACGLILSKPLLLLDEPSASLDEHNTQIVIELIREALQSGTAVIGIFHDEMVRDALSTRSISMQQFQP